MIKEYTEIGIVLVVSILSGFGGLVVLSYVPFGKEIILWSAKHL